VDFSFIGYYYPKVFQQLSGIAMSIADEERVYDSWGWFEK
jgi:hypothetical protein